MPASSSTTSVRLPHPLRRELERRARATKRGKDWVIKRALEHYLYGSAHDELRRQARSQSLLACQSSPLDAARAETAGDTTDWR